MEENGPIYLPFGLKKFDNQVAGHSSKDGKSLSGLLKGVDGFVLKPLTKFPAGDNEVKFYENLKLIGDLILLREFVPQYFGTLVIRIQDVDVKFLKLQDVSIGLKEPCIMDIKVGAQTWEPSAPFYKRMAEEKYSSTKSAYGFCIPGYQVYELCSGKFKKVGKEEGKLLTKETLPLALKEFFNYDHKYSKFLIDCFLQKLVKLLSWWEKQTIYHFYSSSLLFLYDASMFKELINHDEMCKSTLPWIKLYCIDFAHVVPANDTLDFNYIAGLTKLIDLLKSIHTC
uniref:Kinase n=1 Tax=Rhodnius prolixus TaxID=13249 RepID=R4G803_RHOPR